MESRLVNETRNRQKTLGLSDTRFAAQIGVTARMWDRIRLGESEPGIKFLRGLLGVFPDLAPAVIDFLTPDCNRLQQLRNTSSTDERESA